MNGVGIAFFLVSWLPDKVENNFVQRLNALTEVSLRFGNWCF